MRASLLFSGILASLLLHSQTLLAQQPVADGVEMADRLRADGKIWVVVAVIAAIFVGIVVYLARLDMRLGKLEKDMHTHSQQEQDVRIR